MVGYLKISERVLGPVRFHDISRDDLVRLLSVPSDRVRLVFNVNAHALNIAFSDPAFRGHINRADVCFCDGFGVKWLCRFFGSGPVRHRNTPPDFLDLVMEAISKTGGTAYFIGDEPGVAEAYASDVNRRHGEIVVGTHHGYILDDPVLQARVIEDLWRTRPLLVLVGMGMPWQEAWLMGNRERLPPGTYLTVGAAFAWCTGRRRRGPPWAVRNGLEWFCRLLTEPRRVWRRYLIGLPQVVFRLLRHRGLFGGSTWR